MLSHQFGSRKGLAPKAPLGRLSRRKFLGASVLAAGGGLTILKNLRAQAFASPPTRPWVEPLPMPPLLRPVTTLTGPPADPDQHQRGRDFWPPVQYEIRTRQAPHSFHPDLPTNYIWGYNGLYPGPTIVARYYQPFLVRNFNQLPKNHVGFGSPEITTHLHNFHTASASDGFPDDLLRPGHYRDHHYSMMCAGNDDRETMNTMWYHDHCLDFTAANVYRGLAGFCLAFDQHDSGNELDPNPLAFRLPSGPYDVGLCLADKAFDAMGHQTFDPFALDGILGDKYVVNGKIQPYFKVARRKYRFRILNGSVSRIMQVGVSSGRPFDVLSSDGNLLPRPVKLESLLITPAQRRDIIIDFRDYKIGDSVYLENLMPQDSARGPAGPTPQILPAGQGVPMLRFDVDRDAPDPSVVPTFMRELPPINLNEVVTTRVWRFDRNLGAWSVNGRIYTVGEVAATIRQNTAEIWQIEGGGNWWHPVHTHFEEFQILSRNGLPPAPEDAGRMDVLALRPGEVVRIFYRFRDFKGRYVTHCHNTVHEDHAMMFRWDIV
jgi:FtsP/CotA-like multicopper oxidase with cupredoxin domain